MKKTQFKKESLIITVNNNEYKFESSEYLNVNGLASRTTLYKNNIKIAHAAGCYMSDDRSMFLGSRTSALSKITAKVEKEEKSRLGFWVFTRDGSPALRELTEVYYKLLDHHKIVYTK